MMNEASVDTDEINICGVLVHAQPDNVKQVETDLLQQPGVEVHAVTDEGRLVITIEGDDRRNVADTLSKIHSLSGVISAAMVYQFSDDAIQQENPL